MENISNTLDTVIALVIVLLVLSLIVQAIQSLIKKLFKLKSRIVLNSLKDLFKYIEVQNPKGLVDRVRKEFGKLGRLSFFNNPIVDSVEKDDLIKILKKIEPGLEDQAAEWFDTVKRSFDERYTRHMRTFAVLISVVVVVYLNASFFRVYQNIAHNDVQRSLIVSKGEELLASAKQAEQESSAAATPTPVSTATPRAEAPQVIGTNVQPNQAPPSPSPTPTPDEVKEVEEAAHKVSDLVSTYEQFGFSPLTRDQIKTWFANLKGQTQVRDAQGTVLNKANKPIERNCVGLDRDGKPLLDKNGQPVDCQPAWRAMTSDEWWAGRSDDVQTLIGWALMVLLLSVGAPFWEDTLGSLFGIKNLLQKKNKKSNGQDKEDQPS